MVQRGRERGQGGKIVLVQRDIRLLLSNPKSLRNQLVIEGPVLQALRAGEIGTLHSEWVDLANSDLRVLDSKKNVVLTVPLDYTFAKHAIAHMKATGIYQGEFIRGQKRTGKGLTVGQIERIWTQECQRCGIPVMSPRFGRAYKAMMMLMGYDPATGKRCRKKSIKTIQNFLRHDDLQSTEHYLYEDVIDYESWKAEYYEDTDEIVFYEDQKDSPFGSQCTRAESCPVSCPGCRCKFFQPRIEGQLVPSAAPVLRDT